MNNALFVGIDVSSKDNVACIMKPDGEKHSIFPVPNNHSGAELLVDKIVSVLRQILIPKVIIGMEYGDNLMYFLRETGKFSGFEKKLHMLSQEVQRRLFRFSENDQIDALIIADHLRFGRITKEVYMETTNIKT